MWNVQRETWVDARTSATSGTASLGVKAAVSSLPLAYAKELIVYLDVTTELDGTSPTMDLYIQRAIKPSPANGTDADWDDLYAFDQVTTSTIQRCIRFNHLSSSGSINQTSASWVRSHATLTADVLHDGMWGDEIRIVEKIGGTVTQAAVYSMYATAIAFNAMDI